MPDKAKPRSVGALPGQFDCIITVQGNYDEEYTENWPVVPVGCTPRNSTPYSHFSSRTPCGATWARKRAARVGILPSKQHRWRVSTMKTFPILTPEYLESLGHKRMSPLKAIRARCLDCCVFQPKEVALCAHKTCPSWPFRYGKNPYAAGKVVSEASRVALERVNKKRAKDRDKS